VTYFELSAVYAFAGLIYLNVTFITSLAVLVVNTITTVSEY